MGAKTLSNIRWFRDTEAASRGEPGLCQSYIASLATILKYMEEDVDPVWLMGVSGFAFRIFVHESLCPSAMSEFEWKTILPETNRQAGFNANYVSRFWFEKDMLTQRVEQAYRFIVEGIERDMPAIAWDVITPEWGLIIGYDDNKQVYHVLDDQNSVQTLDYSKLGFNNLEILQVTVLNEACPVSRNEIIRNSLTAAVNHARQREWMDRPAFQNGLAAFDLWATILDRGALLAEQGKIHNVGQEIPEHAYYYGQYHYSARCYGREYLLMIAEGNAELQEAASYYKLTTDCIQPVWLAFQDRRMPQEADIYKNLAATIRKAKEHEERGILAIENYLSKF